MLTIELTTITDAPDAELIDHLFKRNQVNVEYKGESLKRLEEKFCRWIALTNFNTQITASHPQLAPELQQLCIDHYSQVYISHGTHWDDISERIKIIPQHPEDHIDGTLAFVLAYDVVDKMILVRYAGGGDIVLNMEPMNEFNIKRLGPEHELDIPSRYRFKWQRVRIAPTIFGNPIKGYINEGPMLRFDGSEFHLAREFDPDRMFMLEVPGK